MDTQTVATLNIAITVIGFIATIASLILAIGAIWLSFVFYKMSNDASKDTTKAAKDVQSSVERLEKIFDKLYSDTFSMMKDTVTDMRHHIWRKPIAEEKNGESEDKFAEIKSSITEEIISIIDEKFKDVGESHNKIQELESSIKNILQNKLEKSIKPEKAPTSLQRRRLLRLIEMHNGNSVGSLIKQMKDIYGDSDKDLIMQFFNLRESNLITWNGSENEISNSTIVKYISPEN